MAPRGDRRIEVTPAGGVIAAPFSILSRRIGIPGVARLGRDIRKAHAGWRIGDADQEFAGWTLNLPAGELRLALERLIAVGTVEFEFVIAHSLCIGKRKPWDKSMSKLFHTFCRHSAPNLVDERRNNDESRRAT